MDTQARRAVLALKPKPIEEIQEEDILSQEGTDAKTWDKVKAWVNGRWIQHQF